MSFDIDPRDEQQSFPCQYCACGDVVYDPTERTWICDGCGHYYGERVT
jgi:hypothetical protein